MTKIVLASLLSFAGVLWSGCGALEQTNGCDFQPKKNRCQERRTLPTSTTVWEATCKAIPDSRWAAGGCPTASRIGGCDVSEAANPIVDWYYTPTDANASIKTAADVMAQCQTDGGKYVAP